jgi:hypothetical protein
MKQTMEHRLVPYEKVKTDWAKFLIAAQQDPASVLQWIEQTLRGNWAYRVPSRQEAQQWAGWQVPQGAFFLLVAFEDPEDAQAFGLWQTPSEGRA